MKVGLRKPSWLPQTHSTCTLTLHYLRLSKALLHSDLSIVDDRLSYGRVSDDLSSTCYVKFLAFSSW